MTMRFVRETWEMARFTCQFCDQPATIHETLVETAGVVERHLCRAHGGPVWSTALPNERAVRLPKEWTDRTRQRFDDLQRGGR